MHLFISADIFLDWKIKIILKPIDRYFFRVFINLVQFYPERKVSEKSLKKVSFRNSESEKTL